MRISVLPIALAMLGAIDAHALTLTPDSKWRETRIPVCWEDPDPAHKQERTLVRKAVRLSWEAESTITFTDWRSCRSDSVGIRIVTKTDFPRTLKRGRFVSGVSHGMVLPELWGLAALSVNLKAPVHEFGHALGFGHEYARPDAPSLEECGTTISDGSIYIESDEPLTPYDADSVMVACVATATVRMSLGVPRLSAGDIFGLVRTYGSHPDHILDLDEAGDRFGASLTLADLDGDGQSDLAVGAPGEDDGKGAVYVYRGDKVRGFRPMIRLSPEDFPDLVGKGFGAALKWASVSGDGLGRLRVGVLDGDLSYLYRPGRKALPVADRLGNAIVSSGVTDASIPLDHADLGRFGFPLAGIRPGTELVTLTADLNADGIEDLVVGAPETNGAARHSGTVTVFRGEQQNGAISYAPWYWFGQSY